MQRLTRTKEHFCSQSLEVHSPLQPRVRAFSTWIWKSLPALTFWNVNQSVTVRKHSSCPPLRPHRGCVWGWGGAPLSCPSGMEGFGLHEWPPIQPLVSSRPRLHGNEAGRKRQSRQLSLKGISSSLLLLPNWPFKSLTEVGMEVGKKMLRDFFD